ncbi:MULTISPECIES: PQQ-binding-like beta-propeller repeat protein [unclassified Streptomyces]|uniref:outer membrane protein assembly factor BamB family protein n=1 Tax=unclassified Streptomyces TaxID=2593676 RepID=UPI002ED1157D|nr:PQQ-binding-like beta-propeller repeat protein [Streptomyces sp. NBC_00891]WSY07851.1 PQQ-binding-like beta-propeller repeat protein [Streptomyces sp. NBC_00890]WSZ09477.1 PQQ-binding-like beta-propeller repeat protein [Streptomyces sp. NBC_00869]WSZ23024.1 PQQ-binding-like beta-propeller repeat protein [Streptomyces sp. NBC_00870]
MSTQGGKCHMLGPLRGDSAGTIGPYRILARLGADATGEVFLGDRGGSTTPVAVRTVRRDVARDPALRDRLRQGITVARSVTGPHLAPLLDADADAEPPWLATAYVAGPTLSAAVRWAGAMGEAEVRMLGAGTARALAAVHAAGTVHGDVGPGSVVLAADGPRLIGSGPALLPPPERVADGGQAVPASDVLRLASVLRLAATGRDELADGPGPAVDPAGTDLTGVPEALRAVLEDCLAADPAARPTAAELAERLTPGAADRWPGAVRGQITEYERELAQVVALDGPLLPGHPPAGDQAAPHRPPTAAGFVAPHQPPTAAPDFVPSLHLAPPEAPGVPAPPRRPRRAFGAALATLVLLGAATGGYLAWRDDGPAGPARGGGSRPVTIVAGVGEKGGPDASGTVPYGRDVRPAGWKKSWKGRLSQPPLGCSAGREALVCRLVDGSYEALSAADGQQLWGMDAGLETGGKEAHYGPNGALFVPAGATLPTVYDDTVLFVVGGSLQSVDIRTGKWNWETRAGEALALESAPVVVGDLVLAEATRPDGPQLIAVDRGTGVEKWHLTLAGNDLPNARKANFWPVATDGKAAYAITEQGPKAFRPVDGKLLGSAGGEAEPANSNSGCGDLRLRGASAFCATSVPNGDPSGFGEDMSVLRFTAGDLRARGRVTVDAALAAGARLSALDDRVMVLSRGDEYATSVPDEIAVVRRADGRTVGRFPLTLHPGKGTSNPVSAPLIVADTVVWADTSTLYTVAVRPDGTLGTLRKTPVRGAPGPGATPDYDRAQGIQLGEELLPPQVLPMGGVVHVVYDDGTVVSVPLPG